MSHCLFACLLFKCHCMQTHHLAHSQLFARCLHSPVTYFDIILLSCYVFVRVFISLFCVHHPGFFSFVGYAFFCSFDKQFCILPPGLLLVASRTHSVVFVVRNTQLAGFFKLAFLAINWSSLFVPLPLLHPSFELPV